MVGHRQAFRSLPLAGAVVVSVVLATLLPTQPDANARDTAPEGALPGRPGNVAVEPGDGRAVVRWTAAKARGSAIRKYQVESRRSTSSGWKPWINKPVARSARSVVLKARNGSVLEVRVRAKSAAGVGRWSRTVQATVGRVGREPTYGERRPAPPDNSPSTVQGVALAVFQDELTVSWSGPVGGGPVDRYEVNYRFPDESAEWSVNSEPASAREVVMIMRPGVRVQVFVVASNDWGRSAPGATHETTLPLVPVGEIEAEFLRLTNVVRGQGVTCGAYGGAPEQWMPPVAPVVLDLALGAAARAHAEDMIARDYFSHVTPEGDGPDERAFAAGYTGPYTGENLHAGQQYADGALASLLGSPGHCRNMMQGKWTSLGAGVARNAVADQSRFVQLFGLAAED